MKLGGLPLSKWKFSHPELREEGEVEEQEEEQKILGIIWNRRFWGSSGTPRMIPWG